MTHRAVRTFLVAGVVVLMAAATQAQQPPQRRGGTQGGGFGGFGGPSEAIYLTALRNENVQKELELVDDQKAKLRTASEELAAKMREGGGQPGRRGNQDQQTEEERNKARAERDKRNLELGKEIKAKLGEILLPHQMERLTEIALQARGTRALQDPAVAKELVITEEQKAQLTKIEEEGRGQRGAGGGGAGGFDIEALRKRMQEQADKMLAVLTPDQKAKFEKMQGEKFAGAEQLLFGGIGRRGGNNNNNN